MSTVTHYGHGIWCYACHEVHDGTDECDHRLDRMAGVQQTSDGYAAQPDQMGHHGPHKFMEIDGMEQCTQCDRVKIPEELVEGAEADA